MAAEHKERKQSKARARAYSKIKDKGTSQNISRQNSGGEAILDVDEDLLNDSSPEQLVKSIPKLDIGKLDELKDDLELLTHHEKDGDLDLRLDPE